MHSTTLIPHFLTERPNIRRQRAKCLSGRIMRADQRRRGPQGRYTEEGDWGGAAGVVGAAEF